MINKHKAKRYCCEDISKIENYEQAVLDTTQTWECHHRMETHRRNGKPRKYVLSTELLKEWDVYFKRPASELIFLTKAEHCALPESEETKCKMSEALKGHTVSNETKIKLSEANKGKKKPPRSEEHKRHLAEALKGHKSTNGQHWKLVDGKRIYYKGE